MLRFTLRTAACELVNKALTLYYWQSAGPARCLLSHQADAYSSEEESLPLAVASSESIEESCTALYAAFWDPDRCSKVADVLARKADPRSAGRDGLTVYDWVASEGAEDVMDIILRSSPPGLVMQDRVSSDTHERLLSLSAWSPEGLGFKTLCCAASSLWTACRSGHLGVVKLLIKEGGSKLLTHVTDHDGGFLHAACLHMSICSTERAEERLDIVKLLLAVGGKALSQVTNCFEETAAQLVSRFLRTGPCDDLLRESKEYCNRMIQALSEGTWMLTPLDLARNDLSDDSLLKSLKKKPRPQNEMVVAFKYSVEITIESIKTLTGKNWLNSEVITFYLEWWAERVGAGISLKMPTSTFGPKCYIMTTYFYYRLKKEQGSYNFGNIKRWTKGIDIFALDMVIIPINEIEDHWYLAIINIRLRRIEIYDSIGAKRLDVVEDLFRYVKDEHKSKKFKDLDIALWSHKPCKVGTIPQQLNGYDCGVFMLLFASYASLGRPFDFCQANMPAIRKWMIRVISKA